MDCSPPPSVHRVSQARILEWVSISFSRGSSRPRDWTRVSCTGRRVFCFLPLSHLGKPQHTVKNQEIDSHKILLTQVQILFRVCQNISDYLSSLNLNQFPFKRPPVSSYCHPGQCKSKAWGVPGSGYDIWRIAAHAHVSCLIFLRRTLQRTFNKAFFLPL